MNRILLRIASTYKVAATNVIDPVYYHMIDRPLLPEFKKLINKRFTTLFNDYTECKTIADKIEFIAAQYSKIFNFVYNKLKTGVISAKVLDDKALSASTLDDKYKELDPAEVLRASHSFDRSIKDMYALLPSYREFSKKLSPIDFGGIAAIDKSVYIAIKNKAKGNIGAEINFLQNKYNNEKKSGKTKAWNFRDWLVSKGYDIVDSSTLQNDINTKSRTGPAVNNVRSWSGTNRR